MMKLDCTLIVTCLTSILHDINHGGELWLTSTIVSKWATISFGKNINNKKMMWNNSHCDRVTTWPAHTTTIGHSWSKPNSCSWMLSTTTEIRRVPSFHYFTHHLQLPNDYRVARAVLAVVQYQLWSPVFTQTNGKVQWTDWPEDGSHQN